MRDRRRTLRSLALGLASALLAMQSASAAELPLLPGIGIVDRRVAVDPRQQPWEAIAKVQTNIGTHCTGALITPSTVLTAAHCLYNRRTRALLQAGSLHVLLGYNRGDYRWHRLIARYTVGQGFDGSKGGLQGSDWARLEMDGAIPNLIAPLPVATALPPSGATIAMAGYNQDRAQILMADLSCHITGTVMAAGKPFIAHDCDATRGTSGGSLLMRQGSGWAVIGINIGVVRGANLALPATAFAN
jgi:protease YdgD